MIIETGHDLNLLLFGRGSQPGALMLLAMGDDLRAHWVRAIVEPFTGDLDAAVLEGLDNELGTNEEAPEDDAEPGLWTPVRFAALGFWVGDARPHLDRVDWDRVKVITEHLAAKGVIFLGLQAYDGEYWATTGPASVLESYVGVGDEIPRVIVIPGPHPFLTCDCAVCKPRRERWEAALAKDVQDSVQ